MGNGGIQAQIDALSPRDRKLLTGLFIVVTVGLVVFVTLTMRSAIADRASRVVAQKEALADMRELQVEYAAAAAEIEAAETRLAGFAGKPLPAYLEETATKAKVRENLTVNRQGTEVEGGIETTRYRVELDKVGYDLALNFVYDLETGGYPVTVETMKMTSRVLRGEQEMKVTLELATFKILEEEG